MRGGGASVRVYVGPGHGGSWQWEPRQGGRGIAHLEVGLRKLGAPRQIVQHQAVAAIGGVRVLEPHRPTQQEGRVTREVQHRRAELLPPVREEQGVFPERPARAQQLSQAGAGGRLQQPVRGLWVGGWVGVVLPAVRVGSSASAGITSATVQADK